MTGSSELCLACGLCCDGTLFSRVTVSTEEAARLPDAGVAVGEHDKEPVIDFPCPALDGRCCRIYAERPGQCRAYRCRLLRAVEAGATSPEEALSRISEATRLKAALVALGRPGESTVALRSRAVAETAEPSVRLAAMVLEYFLDRHFRAQHQRRLTGAEERR